MPVPTRSLRRGLSLSLAMSGCAWAQFSPGPLSKAHASLSGPAHCTACHAVAAGARKFKCLSCHTDLRQELLARRGLHPSLGARANTQEECIRCHSEHNGEDFVPIRWDVSLDEFDHGKTGYPLTGGHAHLRCRQCHAPEHIVPAERRRLVVKDLRRTYLGLSRACLSCHADEHRGQLGPDCQRCHTDSRWKPASDFDHAGAKFQLAGAHEHVACRKCHPAAGDPKPYIKFVGLSFAACTPCHSDPHRSAFAAPCQSCHSVAVWKPARNASLFDHSKTHFPLLGKHAGLACEKCHHTSNFKEPVAHAKCMDCHGAKDVHQGQFLARADGGECSACHVVDGWRPSTFLAEQHRATRYPLEGRHAAVPCARCHVPAGPRTLYRVRFERCTDCHADVHQAQFTGPPHDNRCQDCHTTGGFRPSTFTLARHGESRFPLGGAHAAVPCGDCHRGDPKPARFHFQDRSCTACHQDPHRGQFRERLVAARGAAPAGCEACHSLRTWRDLSRFDHTTTSFPLVASHRAVACRQCHRPAASGGIESVAFRAASRQCSGCHEDIHGGQFAAGPRAADCARCHTALKWTPSRFDHGRDSTFALAGAHQRVACALCHNTRRQMNGKVVLLYRLTPHECSSCHSPEIAN